MGGSSRRKTNPSGTRRLLREELSAVTDRTGIHEITGKTKTAGSKIRPVSVRIGVAFVVLGFAVSKEYFQLQLYMYGGRKSDRLDCQPLFVEEARAPPPEGEGLRWDLEPYTRLERAAEIEPANAAGNGKRFNPF